MNWPTDYCVLVHGLTFPVAYTLFPALIFCISIYKKKKIVNYYIICVFAMCPRRPSHLLLQIQFPFLCRGVHLEQAMQLVIVLVLGSKRDVWKLRQKENTSNVWKLYKRRDKASIECLKHRLMYTNTQAHQRYKGACTFFLFFFLPSFPGLNSGC